MMRYDFYAYMDRMRYIKRWQLMRSLRDENIMEHSQSVTVLAHALVTIHNETFGGNADVAKTVSADREIRIMRKFALSEREVEIALMMLEGFTNRQISSALKLSEGTTRNYISTIYIKTNSENRQGAIAAIRQVL